MENTTERIVHKISFEISNMMQLNFEKSMEVEQILFEMFNSTTDVRLFGSVSKIYSFIEKHGVKPKQRRGIGYKIDVLINKGYIFGNNGMKINFEKI